MQIDIYTDGSSLDNGKPHCKGGWSAIFFLNGKMYVRYGHLKAQSSNNRGEVSGILYTMDLMREKKDWFLNIFSDSQYAVKSVNEWRHKWKKTNYDGIKNPDLLIPLFNLYDMHGNSKLSWVKGHADSRGNQLADEFAGYGMRNVKHDKQSDKVDIRMIDESFISEAQLHGRYKK